MEIKMTITTKEANSPSAVKDFFKVSDAIEYLDSINHEVPVVVEVEPVEEVTVDPVEEIVEEVVEETPVEEGVVEATEEK